MTLAELHNLTQLVFSERLLRCCGSSKWVAAMHAQVPFASAESLHLAADDAWARVDRSDILEAFSHHPQIGADLDSLRQKFAKTATWSASEQSGVAAADEATLQALAKANQDYLNKFGYIFIVCATGQTAASMLALCQQRLNHDDDTELKIAAAEQAKIMHLRLNKLLELS